MPDKAFWVDGSLKKIAHHHGRVQIEIRVSIQQRIEPIRLIESQMGNDHLQIRVALQDPFDAVSACDRPHIDSVSLNGRFPSRMDIENPVEFENGLVDRKENRIVRSRPLDVAMQFQATQAELFKGLFQDISGFFIFRMKRGQAGRMGKPPD